jgi:hypothetical protein
MIPAVRLRLSPWRTADGLPDGVALGWIDWQPFDRYAYLAMRVCYEQGLPVPFGDASYYILDWDETSADVDKPLT